MSEKVTTDPVEAEALELERVSFTWRNTEFTALATADWPFEAIEAFEDGMVTKFLREVLGDAEYAKFKTLKPRAKDIDDFVESMQKALGIQGN